jgi:hypothetical protein
MLCKNIPLCLRKKKSRTDVSSKGKGKAPKRVVSHANSDDDVLGKSKHGLPPSYGGVC